MKGYAFRFWVANALIVCTLSLITVVLYGCAFPLLPQVPSIAVQGLVVVVSLFMLSFALIEAVMLYRSWKANTTTSQE